MGVDKRGLLVRGRVTFMSIGGKNPKGNVTRRLELEDGSTVEPMSLTLVGSCVHLLDKVSFHDLIAVRNVRSGNYQDKTTLLGTDGDNITISVEVDLVEKELPSLDVHSVSDLAELPSDPIKLLVQVAEHGKEGALLVRDPQHVERTANVKLMNEAEDFPFTNGDTYILHGVRPVSAGVTLWPSAGVERAGEALFLNDEGEDVGGETGVTQLDSRQEMAQEDL